MKSSPVKELDIQGRGCKRSSLPSKGRGRILERPWLSGGGGCGTPGRGLASVPPSVGLIKAKGTDQLTGVQLVNKAEQIGAGPGLGVACGAKF